MKTGIPFSKHRHTKKLSHESEGNMIQLISTTLIQRPIKQVFDFISSAKNDVKWQYGALATSQLTLHPVGLGTLFSSLSHFMGRRLQSKFEVTEYEPNKKYGFRSLSGPIQTETLYHFEIYQDGGTRVDANLHVNQSGFFKLPDALVTRFALNQLKENLAVLKNYLESDGHHALTAQS
jgi:hypothetical protein